MDNVPLPRTSRLWKSKADFFRPFRSAANEVGENITPLYSPGLSHQEGDEPDLKALNASLAVLVDIFPDVEPEVFREMLLQLGEESRLQVVTEQLLKTRAKRVRGRHRITKLVKMDRGDKKEAYRTSGEAGDSLPLDQTFRSDTYRQAVKQTLYQEFKNLSHSTIKGVMAENNYSYTLSRPTLQQLSAKSWRFSLSSFWPRRSPSGSTGDHPAVVWQTEGSPTGEVAPAIKRTGSVLLDHELYQLFVEPVICKQHEELVAKDHALASQINEAQAIEAETMFDCECCYSSVPFERIAACDSNCHYLCFNCIQHMTKEALYGQGWARSVDLEKSTLRCFASALQECQGCIPPDLARRALELDSRAGTMWQEFQTRATTEVLNKSRMPLQRCPFCSYAEVDETPAPRLRGVKGTFQHVFGRSSAVLQCVVLTILTAMLFFTVPALLCAGLAWLIISILPPAARIIDTSWARVHKARRTLKFKCGNDACRKVSCMRCTAQWRDPHICFETETASLRTAIESSATAAIKRTCPKCMLSFVKSSGCNKLVCNCGYTMCYVCRSEITSKEGYGHFCQHFRPHGGRCSECERCNLYGDEDEEAAIRNAATAAEKAWREKDGVAIGNDRAKQLMVETLVSQGTRSTWYEEWLDAVVDALVV